MAEELAKATDRVFGCPQRMILRSKGISHGRAGWGWGGIVRARCERQARGRTPTRRNTGVEQRSLWDCRGRWGGRGREKNREGSFGVTLLGSFRFAPHLPALARSHQPLTLSLITSAASSQGGRCQVWAESGFVSGRWSVWEHRLMTLNCLVCSTGLTA